MEAPATNLDTVIEKTLKEILEMLREDPSGESEIKKVVNNIKEIGKNDLKAQVILKQQLDNLVALMEEELDTEPSSNASKIMCFFGGLSSKGRLNDNEKPKVKKALERVADKAKYLKEKMKELKAGESEKDLKLVGREKEAEEIIDQLILLSRSEDGASPRPVPVIAITGLAGLGKRELVRRVCKDENLRPQVGLPAWVNGSNHNKPFDAASIAKEAIEAVVKDATPFQRTENLNIIVILEDWRVEIEDKHLKELQEKVKDGWRAKIDGMDLKAMREELENNPSVEIGEQIDEKAFRDKLKEVRVAAILITTTRSCLVVKNIAASPVKSYALPGLDEKRSMSLFQTTIHGRDNITEDVRRKIVGQCRGVPLAIEIMGNLIRSRPSLSTELTEEFLQLVWYCYFHDEYSVELLLCFGYCSMFPQDYLIDAERLIHLWMAERFIKSEEEGVKFLGDLVGRSIFKDVKEDEFEQVRSFRMHPLMHDMAKFLIDTLDMKVGSVTKVVRASFDMNSDFSRGIPATMVEKAKEIKSMFFFSKTQSRVSLQREMSAPIFEYILKSSFKGLCVLDLRSLQIVTVPGSIGELNNLEYLDLSLNDMEKLPNSITKLSELQTLKLSRCYLLKELPKNMENLTKLAHLDIEGCLGLTQMPRNMSKMSFLQTLPAFVANKNDPMGGLEEINTLTHLRGSLEILHLERVQSPLEKPSLVLQKKQHLKRLTLRWDIDLAVDEEEGKSQLALLNSLEPHSGLKVLILVGYQGLTFSTWINPFKGLVKLSLQDCHGCIYISQQDQLPNLRILELLRFDKLEYIVAQKIDDKGTNGQFYQNLKELIITDCPKLRSWWENEKEVKDRPVFASISKLHVHNCPELTCMPLYPRLNMVPEGSTSFGKDMFLEGSSLQLLLDTKSEVSSIIPLESLQILNCNHLENMFNGFRHLGSLQSLRIENCAGINLDSYQWEGLKSLRFLTLREIPSLKSLSFGDSVTTLRELSLQNCHGLISISDSIGKLTSLRELTLQNCQGLTSISNSIGKVTSLGRLVISKCNKLKSLPKEMKDLESLRTLIISECALLLPRLQPETGDDWPQISHIEDLQVY